jgi:hypothetical protein
MRAAASHPTCQHVHDPRCTRQTGVILEDSLVPNHVAPHNLRAVTGHNAALQFANCNDVHVLRMAGPPATETRDERESEVRSGSTSAVLLIGCTQFSRRQCREHWPKLLPTHQLHYHVQGQDFQCPHMDQCAWNLHEHLATMECFFHLLRAPRTAAYSTLAVLSVQGVSSHEKSHSYIGSPICEGLWYHLMESFLTNTLQDSYTA